MVKRNLLLFIFLLFTQFAFSVEPEVLFERANDAFVRRDFEEAKDLFQKYLFLFPEGEDRMKAQYFVGESLYQLGKYGDAIDAFQKVVEHYPKEAPLVADALNRIGDSFLKLGNPGGAMMFYERVVKDYPNTHQAEYAQYSISWMKTPQLKVKPVARFTEDVLLQMAKTSFLKKDYTKAKEEFLEFLKAFPKSPHAPYAKLKVGECNYYLGNYQDALKEYEEVVKRWGESKWANYAQYSIGWAYYRMKKYEEALEAWNELREKYPRSRYIEALDEIEPKVKKEVRKKEWEALYRDAKSEYKMGNLGSSYKKFQELINKYPDSPYTEEAKKMLSKIKEKMYPEAERLYKEASSLHEAGGYREAIEKYRRVIAQYPGTEYEELARRALQLIMEEVIDYEAGELWRKAEKAVGEGRYEDATSLYQKIIEDYPTTLYAKQARKKVNEILLKAENLEAERIYKKALAHLKEGKFLEAIDEFNRIILTYPKSDYAKPAKEGVENARRSLFELQAKRRYELADEYMKLGDWKKALEEFHAVKKTYPNTLYAEKAEDAIEYITGLLTEKEAEKVYNLARHLYKEGKIGEAFNEFKRLIDLYPESTYTEPAREALAKISKEMMDEASKELYDKGRGYQRNQNYKRAIQAYDELLKRYPTSHWAPYAQYAKAEVYYVAHADWRRAITEWMKVVENYPNHELSPHALYHVGECYEKLKEWDRAKATYKRLAEEYPESMYGRGELAQFIRAFIASTKEGIRD
jgi:tol-pal system protein YbgF